MEWVLGLFVLWYYLIVGYWFFSLGEVVLFEFLVVCFYDFSCIYVFFDILWLWVVGIFYDVYVIDVLVVIGVVSGWKFMFVVVFKGYLLLLFIVEYVWDGLLFSIVIFLFSMLYGILIDLFVIFSCDGVKIFVSF